MRISYYPCDAGKSSQFLRSTLGIASGDNHTRRLIFRADLSDGCPRLSVSSGRYGARVDNNDVSYVFGGWCITPLQQLMFKRRSVCLRRATSKLFNIKSWHGFESVAAVTLLKSRKREQKSSARPR